MPVLLLCCASLIRSVSDVQEMLAQDRFSSLVNMEQQDGWTGSRQSFPVYLDPIPSLLDFD